MRCKLNHNIISALPTLRKKTIKSNIVDNLGTCQQVPKLIFVNEEIKVYYFFKVPLATLDKYTALSDVFNLKDFLTSIYFNQTFYFH